MDAVGRRRNRDMGDAVDTSEHFPLTNEKHFCAEDILLAFVVEDEVVKGHVQRLDLGYSRIRVLITPPRPREWTQRFPPGRQMSAVELWVNISRRKK